MSGEAGGFVIGGILALAVLPVIVAGVAAVGVAYGAVKAGGALAKYAAEEAEQKRREKELVVNQCSAELDHLYSQMRSIVSDEVARQTEFAQQHAAQFERLGSQLEVFRNTHPDPDKLNAEIASAQSEMEENFSRECQSIRREIIDTGKKNLQKTLVTLESALEAKAELEEWKSSTAQATAVQKQTAQSALDDARASVAMLEGMKSQTEDAAFRQEVDSMKRALLTAESFMDRQQYQSAFSSARTIIRTSAVLASEQVQKELEMDMMRMELLAKTESLLEEMDHRRRFEFCDESREDKRVVKVDLNKFSQGKYAQMQEALQKQLAFLTSPAAARMSVYEMQKLCDAFDKETEPAARHILEMSLRIMAGYYERRNVLDVIAEFMKEQGYQMQWAMPEANDPSQKLVVHFLQLRTNNSVSVTLDYDANAENLASMAMEVMTYFDAGRPVTEAEKEQLRKEIMNALKKADMDSSLSCKGSLNQSSAQTDMKDKEAVKNKPPKALL